MCVCVCVCVCVQVIAGQLVFSVSHGSARGPPVRLRLDQVQVCDGRWHDLQMELRDVRSGRETRYVATLRLDFGLYQVSLPRPLNPDLYHTLPHQQSPSPNLTL